MNEKIKCPTCSTEVSAGNFCTACGGKLKTKCDCWVLKKEYNCNLEKCPGKELIRIMTNRFMAIYCGDYRIVQHNRPSLWARVKKDVNMADITALLFALALLWSLYILHFKLM